jgi:hypothetical protein
MEKEKCLREKSLFFRGTLILLSIIEIIESKNLQFI